LQSKTRQSARKLFFFYPILYWLKGPFINFGIAVHFRPVWSFGAETFQKAISLVTGESASSYCRGIKQRNADLFSRGFCCVGLMFLAVFRA
jgi:hypothetical protein